MLQEDIRQILLWLILSAALYFVPAISKHDATPARRMSFRLPNQQCSSTQHNPASVTEGHLRSSDMAQFEKPYMTSYY